MTVERFSPQHALWPAYLAHLERVDMARWVIGEDGLPLEGLHFLGAVEKNRVIGNISLKLQDIVSPATNWSGGRETTIVGLDGQPLRETFVCTFAVEKSFRRRGHGRALQLAALALTRALGAYQMRSWSSLDKPANYALKISLGFAVHPATQQSVSGYPVSGVYFIKTV